MTSGSVVDHRDGTPVALQPGVSTLNRGHRVHPVVLDDSLLGNLHDPLHFRILWELLQEHGSLGYVTHQANEFVISYRREVIL